MSATSTLGDVLDAAESLDYDTRVELLSVLTKRLAEDSREQLVKRLEQSRAEFAAGQFQVLTAAEIISQAESP